MMLEASRVIPGLSPRGRGKPAYPARCCAVAGSIPAWAGETLTLALYLRVHRVYPRVGGGNVVSSLGAQKAYTVYPRVGGGNQVVAPRAYRDTGLSPRGRGKRGNEMNPAIG